MASVSLERLPLLGLVAGVGAQLGCAPEQGSNPCVGQTYDPPPELELVGTAVSGGRWLSSTTLELQFTAPISSEGLDPDPARFGVIGFSVTASAPYDSCYVQTRYGWLGATASYYTYNPVSSTGVEAVWIPPEDNTVLRLRIATPEECPLPPNVNLDEPIGSGVLLGYAGSNTQAGNRLLDEQGDPLGDIGEEWVDDIEACIEADYGACAGDFVNSGQLPRLTNLLPIPCPD